MTAAGQPIPVFNGSGRPLSAAPPAIAVENIVKR
jgi:hypothetical protein